VSEPGDRVVAKPDEAMTESPDDKSAPETVTLSPCHPVTLSAPFGAPAPEEVDVWWGAYSPRTMVPVFVVSALLTGAVLALGWYLGIWPGYNPARSIIQVGILVLWLGELLLWVYRVIGTSYRLTNRFLYIDRGFRGPALEAIALNRIRQVVVDRRSGDRWLRIGRIRIVFADAAQALVWLEGVAEPDHVALLMHRQISQNRQDDGTAG
jgi:hypothetical protein